MSSYENFTFVDICLRFQRLSCIGRKAGVTASFYSSHSDGLFWWRLLSLVCVRHHSGYTSIRSWTIVCTDMSDPNVSADVSFVYSKKAWSLSEALGCCSFVLAWHTHMHGAHWHSIFLSNVGGTYPRNLCDNIDHNSDVIPKDNCNVKYESNCDSLAHRHHNRNAC